MYIFSREQVYLCNISQVSSHDNADTDAQTHTSQHQIACRKHNNTSAKPDKFCRITKLKQQKEKPIRKEHLQGTRRRNKHTSAKTPFPQMSLLGGSVTMVVMLVNGHQCPVINLPSLICVGLQEQTMSSKRC